MREILRLSTIKKGQAAMEFLMTYGWALLVVLVAIGALAFFGLLNPGQFLPDQCVFFAGVSCLDYFASATTGISVTIQNGLGYTMTAVNVLFKDKDGVTSYGSCSLGPFASIIDGGTQVCIVPAPVPAIVEGDKVTGTLELSWTDNGGQTRTRDGQFAFTVEQ